MLYAIDCTREINRFRKVAIPTSRDLYAKYGERVSNGGISTTTEGELNEPAIVAGGSIISQVIRSQAEIEKLCKTA